MNTTNTQIIPQSELLTTTISLMNQVNQTCFNGELNLMMPVKLSNRANIAGHVSIRYNRFTGVWIAVGMKISKNFDWTYEQLKNVIAHELIHIYEAQILKQKPGHQSNFKRMMMKINYNGQGFKVATRHSMTSTKVKNAKIVQIPYILSECKTKFNPLSLMLCKELTQNPEIAARYYGKYTIGQIASDKLANYKIRRSLSGYYRMIPAKLLELGISESSDHNSIAA